FHRTSHSQHEFAAHSLSRRVREYRVDRVPAKWRRRCNKIPAWESDYHSIMPNASPPVLNFSARKRAFMAALELKAIAIPEHVLAWPPGMERRRPCRART